MARNGGLGALLLAGAAAFGVYKYTKMTEQQKRDLKDKARRFYEDNVPQDIRNTINGKRSESSQTASASGPNGAGY